jgi:hypothetical protein
MCHARVGRARLIAVGFLSTFGCKGKAAMALRDPTGPVEERPVHPRAPRPKQRAIRGYRVPPRDRRHGLVVLHTGDGKGKTTAALGILLRASGREMKVAMLQLEHVAARRLGVEIVPLGSGFTWLSDVGDPRRTHLSARLRLAYP